MVCPLCRKSVDSEASLSLPTTRLCEGCRSLVHSIAPANDWGSESTAETSDYVARTEVGEKAIFQQQERYDEQDYIDADGLDDFGTGHYTQDYNQTEAGNSTSAPWPGISQSGNKSHTNGQPDIQSQTEWPSPSAENHWAVRPAQTTGLAEPQRWNQTFVEAPPPIENQEAQISYPAYQPEETAQTSPAHDPWANPLPPGESSLNEWPILVGEKKVRSASGLRVILGVVLLAALGVAGYFFAYKPFFAPKQAGSRAVATNNPPQTVPAQPTSSQPAVDAPKPETASAPSQPPAATTPQVTPLSTEEKPGTPAASTDPVAGEGAFSLQAISSSSQDEANRFSEKLMRAGISAYVIPADIPGRGRWYRVRIGRFGTREEALKYGEQSRMRAKAAGIKLDLIVSPYEKP